MYAKCHTVGCENQLVPIPVTGEVQVVCGPCGQPITDLTDTPSELPKEVPAWLE